MTEKVRIYGQWAGNPQGYCERTDRCVEKVAPGWLYIQCSRKRGHGKDGLYCKQHSKWHPATAEEQRT